MASLKGQHLPFEKIMAFLDSVEGITRINISGGEPLSHPDFYRIIKRCYEITDDVWVYTNMIRQLRYNADMVKEVIVEANVCLVPGTFKYIPLNSPVRLLPMVSTGRAKDLPTNKVYASNSFYRDETHNCEECGNILLQADGQIVESPCKKRYILKAEDRKEP
jgi:organic radical activating enzyme